MMVVNELDEDSASAIAAWRAFCGSRTTCTGVEILKRGSAFRLRDSGPGCTNVIAKREPTRCIEREIRAYEILDRLSILSARRFGTASTRNGSTWLFLEDIGDHRFERESASDRRALAVWTATLHKRGEHARESGLPVRHLDDHRVSVNSARSALTTLARDDERDRDVLLMTSGELERLNNCWAVVDRYCSGFPMTLVHGDLVAKNVRMRGTDVHVIDWETATISVPAIDIGSLDLDVYYDQVADHWPQLDRAAWTRHAAVGRALRLAASIEWAVVRLAGTSRDRGVAALADYRVWLSSATDELERLS